MTTNYHEEITKLLDSAGLIDKTLSLGCRIGKTILVSIKHEPKYLIANFENGITEIEETYRVTYLYESNLTKDSYCVKNGVPDHWEILGHPWGLQEVVAWLVCKRRETTVMYSMPEIRISGEVRLDGEEYSNFVTVNIDLSKPLSQQDLKPLYELMKSISDNK